MEREEENEGRASIRKERGKEKEDHGESVEVVMCVFTTETDDLLGKRKDRVRRVQRVGEE